MLEKLKYLIRKPVTHAPIVDHVAEWEAARGAMRTASRDTHPATIEAVKLLSDDTVL